MLINKVWPHIPNKVSDPIPTTVIKFTPRGLINNHKPPRYIMYGMKQVVKINFYQKQLTYNRLIFQHIQIYVFTVQINNGIFELKMAPE